MRTCDINLKFLIITKKLYIFIQVALVAFFKINLESDFFFRNVEHQEELWTFSLKCLESYLTEEDLQIFKSKTWWHLSHLKNGFLYNFLLIIFMKMLHFPIFQRLWFLFIFLFLFFCCLLQNLENYAMYQITIKIYTLVSFLLF